MYEIRAKHVLKAMNPTGWVVSLAALMLCIVLVVIGVTTITFNSEGYFRQIYDPDFVGLYTIHTIPRTPIQDALNIMSEPASAVSQDDDIHNVVEQPNDNGKYQLTIKYVYTVPNTTLTLDRLGAGAFKTEFDDDANLQSSCWEKIPLDNGNFYVFISREVNEVAYNLLTDNPNQTIDFKVPLLAKPMLSSDIVRLERALVRLFSDSRQEHVDQGILMTLFISLLGVIAVAAFWKKFVYNSVKRELYMSLAYDLDYGQINS